MGRGKSYLTNLDFFEGVSYMQTKRDRFIQLDFQSLSAMLFIIKELAEGARWPIIQLIIEDVSL